MDRQPTIDEGKSAPAGQGVAIAAALPPAGDVARLRRESELLRRDLRILQDHVADLEGRLARLAPVQRILGIVGVCLSSVAGAARAPFGLARGVKRLARGPAAWRAIKERSRRLHWDENRGQWSSRTDRRAALRHLRRELGLAQPTLYRVRPDQRLGLIRRPRVLHVIPNVWVGGSTQLVVDLHDYLGHRYEMAVATSALPPHGRHKGLSISLISNPASAYAVRTLFAQFRPDLVHIHYWGSVDEAWYEVFFQVAAEQGAPIVQNVNTPVRPHRKVASARTVFVSEAVRETFGSSSQDHVIHPGIDLSQFQPPATVDPAAQRSIGMIYRLERDKLNEASIEPFIEVLRRRPTTRAVIIGDGSLFPHFLRRVEQEGMRDRFEFTGYVPYEALPDCLARFKIFVAPVWQESFGQVTPFAMSMGLAVAGHRVGALPEILGGDETLGNSIDETATRIVSLLDDPSRLEALGQYNHERAQTLFSVRTMANRYAALYGELLPAADPMRGYPPAIAFPA